ncbi:MAG TPA: hypothetical protein VMF55_11205 [Solirubrobacterales bacterium]|nr:hypothetical protein [Solirubrobacterales bacterium]
MEQEQDAKKGLRGLVVRVLVWAAPFVGMSVLKMLQVLTPTGLGRVGGIVMFAAGQALGGRSIVHLKSHYRDWPLSADWTPKCRRRLRRIFVADLLVVLGCSAAGVYFCLSPDNALELPVFAIISTAVLILGIVTIKLLDHGGPPRGCEVVGWCRIVKALRAAAEVAGSIPGVTAIDKKLWDDKTELRTLSGLIVVVWLVLLASAGAQAVPLAPSVIKDLNAGTPKATTTSGIHIAGTLGPKSKLRAERRVSAAAVQPPTAEELCGPHAVPGAGAPKLEAKAINKVWARLGQPATGCSTKARRVPGTKSTFVVPGYCGRQFWSLGVVSPEGASVLLEQSARVARHLLAKGTFRFASKRHDLGRGDFYVLDAARGNYVLVREQKTDGRGGLEERVLSCLEVEPAKERYVVLPPAMAALWLRLEAKLEEPLWPTVDLSHPDSNDSYFTFQRGSDDPTTVATGVCSAPGDCQLLADGLDWHGPASPVKRAVTVSRIIHPYGDRSG